MEIPKPLLLADIIVRLQMCVGLCVLLDMCVVRVSQSECESTCQCFKRECMCVRTYVCVCCVSVCVSGCVPVCLYMLW